MSLLFRYILAAGVLLGAWKVAALFSGAAMFPPPETAALAFARALKTGEFWRHFSVSAFRVGCAMAAAFVVAFPAGLVLGWRRQFDQWLSPFVFLTYPVPKIVLLPVFLIIFGLGDFSRIFMIALIIGYQILVSARDAVCRLDRKYVDSLFSLGGKGRHVLVHVVVPAALPSAFTALRIGTGTGIAVLFFVESFATSSGLGYLIMDAWGRMNYPLMFVGILGMSLLGAVYYEIFSYLERWLCAWKLLESAAKREKAPKAEGPVAVFGRMIKFSHTVFALPFAFSAVILAHRSHSVSGGLFFWIVLALASARSAAMGFNRIADARFDGANPRTASRAIPSGKMSRATAIVFVAVCSGVFVISAAMISRLCLVLSVPVLAVLFFYSYTKRFTSLSHIYLGLAIALAPLGAWIAVTGGFDPRVMLLSMALLTYIAGFDILYACQDVGFDREAGLFSIPARWGVAPAFHVSTGLHVVSFAFFFMILPAFDMGWVYMIALLAIGVLFIAEHRLVSPHDLRRINVAFFHVNSAISVILFLGVLLDEIARSFI